jgi:hypothetical protein
VIPQTRHLERIPEHWNQNQGESGALEPGRESSDPAMEEAGCERQSLGDAVGGEDGVEGIHGDEVPLRS